ncbi:MAG: SPOR domain-containing protein [Gammaproteobacteria bacterium]|nr:SPOR domain-containing protein [Gammaproteobacteria bacterium]
MSKETGAAGTQSIILCLGLLVGFVVGFVLLLSNLPVHDGMAEYDAYKSEPTKTVKNEFDFYQLLPDQVQAPEPVRQPEAVVAATRIEPATRVVPANAQIINPSYANQPAPAYAEVPANYAEPTQSWFLQAGKYLRHEDAQTMRAQVLLLGLEAFIVTREEAEGITAHRVRVGPYYDQHLLTEAKKRLRRGGINYEIVRVTG